MVTQTVSLITGTIRNELEAFKMLEALVKIKGRNVLDLILVSTWVGELEKYPELCLYLNANKIPIIENTKQNFSILQSHQKILILSGLAFCDESSYVTRHRFDRVFPSEVFEDHLRYIKEHGPEKVLIKNLPWDYKITVNSALIDTPFFLNDLIFSGVVKDLYALCSLDVRQYLSFNSEVNPELSFYALPFFYQFKGVSDYISTFPGLVYKNVEKIQQLRAVQLRSDFFARIFALYCYLIVSCFNIGYKRDFFISANKIDLNSLLTNQDYGELKESLFFFAIAGHTASKNSHFFLKVFNEEFINSKFSENVSKNLREFKSGSWIQSIDSNSSSLELNATLYAKNLKDNGFLNFLIPGLSFPSYENQVYKNTQYQIAFQNLNQNHRDTSKLVMGDWEIL